MSESRAIRVVLRIRPLNAVELAAPCDLGPREIAAPTNSTTLALAGQRPKTFNFDHVFGTSTTQEEVFTEVVAPVVDQVLQGFSCTVFAYGQTGSGKTFSMEGDLAMLASSGAEPSGNAGIAPRAIAALFAQTDRALTTIRVSVLEIYNEELQDLLDGGATPLRIVSDPSGSATVLGLVERVVRTPQEAYELLLQSYKRRSVAETKMNKQSSRSHSICTITVAQKELTAGGDEAVRVGKLHLTDLAGSENVARSGAVGSRGREAGNINQSLSALGRVINALVEKRGHVPYRDSKLTRILQDSLGGTAITTILATVSPSHTNYEETLSTLEYATRAKTISNKPKITRQVSDAARARELAAEVARLRTLLAAARSKEGGAFVPDEEYKALEHAAKRLGGVQDQLACREAELKTLTENAKMTAEEIASLRSYTTDLEAKLNEAAARAADSARERNVQMLLAADRGAAERAAQDAVQSLSALLRQRTHEMRRVTARATAARGATAAAASAIGEDAAALAGDAAAAANLLGDAAAAVDESAGALSRLVSEHAEASTARALDAAAGIAVAAGAEGAAWGEVEQAVAETEREWAGRLGQAHETIRTLLSALDGACTTIANQAGVIETLHREVQAQAAAAAHHAKEQAAQARERLMSRIAAAVSEEFGCMVQPIDAITEAVTKVQLPELAAAPEIPKIDEQVLAALPAAKLLPVVVAQKARDETYRRGVKDLVSAGSAHAAAAAESADTLGSAAASLAAALSGAAEILRDEATSALETIATGAADVLARSQVLAAPPTPAPTIASPVVVNPPHSRDTETLLSLFISQYGSPSAIPTHLARVPPGADPLPPLASSMCSTTFSESGTVSMPEDDDCGQPRSPLARRTEQAMDLCVDDLDSGDIVEMSLHEEL